MKPARSIGKSRNARLNRAIRDAEALVVSLKARQGVTWDQPITDAEFWEVGRELVASLAQCLHEANAYNNVMVPDGTTFERDVFELPAREVVEGSGASHTSSAGRRT